MASRFTTYLLLALLLIFQAQLWYGRGSVPHVWELEKKLSIQLAKNQQAKAINEQLLAEVLDLKDGTAIVETLARSELGMVRPNEIFVQYAK
jgi:cell division protein FtsB